MRGRDAAAALAVDLVTRVDAADLFARLAPSAAHREWADDMTQDFTDLGACDLCRAGLCWQRAVVLDGNPYATIVHGLPKH